MKEPRFEFGTVSRGIYYALICGAALVPLLNYKWLPAYLLMLLFLGLGLRAFLERTGLYALFRFAVDKVNGKLDEKWLHNRRRDVERKEK